MSQKETAEFLPTTREEMKKLGWDRCDVILVSGDAYVDHPSFGIAVIGRYLEHLGYRVGVIPQPDCRSVENFAELGLPRLFIGISSGAMDSMVNHYTSLNRLRSDDAYSEGGKPGKRPDRALLKYVNLVQQAMPGVPIVIGGIEASLRRISHYDFWSDRVRRSILLDTKADILVFGMGELSIREIAIRIENGRSLEGIRGTAVYCGELNFDIQHHSSAIQLPTHEQVSSSPASFMKMTRLVERESNPFNAHTLYQKADTRVVTVFPPQFPLTTEQMDLIYDLPYARKPHPVYKKDIPAFTMIQNSITVVRGCGGGCSFCALGLHQGRMIQSRSRKSVLGEVRRLSEEKYFKGIVSDLGGPTANMYGLGCSSAEVKTGCRRVSCLFPSICRHFDTDHSSYTELLDSVSRENSVRKVFINSGIRLDVAERDENFVELLVEKYVSGILKIAPEHCSSRVLKLMRKPQWNVYERFERKFRNLCERFGLEQYITAYLMAAFPGCTMADMKRMEDELKKRKIRPTQVQVFLPTPMTMATAMYFTALHPDTGEKIFVARKPSQKKNQLECLLYYKK